MDIKRETYNASLRTDLIKKLTVLADERGGTSTELSEEATLSFLENLRMEGQEIRTEEVNRKEPEEITEVEKLLAYVCYYISPLFSGQ